MQHSNSTIEELTKRCELLESENKALKERLDSGIPVGWHIDVEGDLHATNYYLPQNAILILPKEDNERE